jgi:hypothetical protein
MKAMAAFLGLLLVPLVILNVGSGVIGGIWITILGRWGLVGMGLAATFISTLTMGFVLLPGMASFVTGTYALDRGKYVLGRVRLILGSLWTFFTMAIWSVGSFHFVLSERTGSSILPYLLWAFAIATGPWTFIAAKEKLDAGAQTPPGSTVDAFGACVGAMSVIAAILLQNQASIFDITIAFCIPVSFVLFLQAFMVLRAAMERSNPLG